MDNYLLESMFRDNPSLNSSFNSSFNASQTSTFSQSWGGTGSPLSCSSHSMTTNATPQKMLRPLSMAKSYNVGMTGPITANAWDKTQTQTNSLANILANTSIQGMTSEHISKLLSPVDPIDPNPNAQTLRQTECHFAKHVINDNVNHSLNGNFYWIRRISTSHTLKSTFDSTKLNSFASLPQLLDIIEMITILLPMSNHYSTLRVCH